MATQLAPLAEVERLSPACLRILGGNPSKFTLQGTNTYLVGTGPRRLLVDTGQGMPSWRDALARVLAQEAAVVEAALITHWHPDHQGGIGQLLELCPDAQVYKNSPGPHQLPIQDGQTFAVAGATLEAAHTPGHTADHVAFVLREEDAMFTGDNVLGHGTAVFEDLSVYVQSLERMARLFRGRVYPGHGPVLPDGSAKVAEYVRHRRDREEQVVRTLRSAKAGAGADDAGAGSVSDDGTGSWTSMELVKVIYRDVPADLHPAAQGGVVQILRKLEREGRAVLEGDERWRHIERSTL